MVDGIRVLIVEDLPTDAELMQREVLAFLPAAEFRRVDNCNDYLEELEAYHPHLILSDFQLPRFDGMLALRLARERRPEIPFLLVTGSLNEETAVDCMKAGAWDYILKHQLRRLGPAVAGALEKKRLREEHRRAGDELRRREEQFRLLVESTEAIAWEYSIPLDLWTYIAPQATTILGYEPEEWRDFDFWLARLHPDDRDWASAYCTDCTERGENHTFEYRFRKKNGEYAWLRDVVSVELRAGRAVTLRGFMLDITDIKRAQKLLAESEERYRSLFENSHAVMLLIDPASGAIVDANPAAAAYYGWSREELCQKQVEDLNTLEPAAVRDEMARSWSGTCRHFQFRHRVANGTLRDVEVFSGPITIGRRTLLFSIVNDISEREKAQAGLRLAQFCIDNAPVGIFQLDDASGRILEANACACASLGYSRDELLGMSVFDIDPQYTREMWERKTVPTGEWGTETLESVCRRKDGTLFPVEVKASRPVCDGEPCFFSFVQDITGRKASERQLEHQATHDGLTGLANRALLCDRLEQSIHYANRSQRPLAVLFLNIDRFKIVNSSLDHGAGDELLVRVARRLADALHEVDTVARLGGDEFVVVLAELAKAEDVAPVVRKIKKALARPYVVGEREVTLTFSIGISLYPQDGGDPQVLLQNASLAMARAKEERDALKFYASDMSQRQLNSLDLEADLRHALERNELLLHYQPKVDLGSGRIVGAEALLRWQHPRRGMVPPGVFIPLAEESGIIGAIGEWVMRQVCRQIADWQDHGVPAVPVAANLSARQFRSGDLVNATRSALDESGIAPHLLELELTESMLMRDPHLAAGTLQEIKALGVRLALDDFGTGYSSLNYLRRFPVDSLKIDRSFIADVATDPSAAAVTASIVAIAHSLGLHAVAEGVETEAQLQFLRTCGCNSYQGFYFSRPVAAAEFARLQRDTAAAAGRAPAAEKAGRCAG